MKIKVLIAFLAVVLCGLFPVAAQNLTAAQMNIYFGQPKKVTVHNAQGVIVTEFDRNGRIESISQGNMHTVYDWEEDGSEVTLTMLQGQNIKGSGVIKISELSKALYSYSDVGTMDVKVDFKNNGAISGAVMSNSQMEVTTKYYYKETDDIFPYAIEQSMGEQSVKVSVTIDRFDSVGNPVEFTQEMMGQKDVTRQTIEYY